MRIIIKVGSKLLSSPQTTSGLNETFIGHLVQQIATLHQQDHEIILVTSGAVATGKVKKKDYPLGRAAMVGQVRLMNAYLRFFDRLPENIRVGQALYTYHDLEGKQASYTKEMLIQGFKWKEITIVNANDAVMGNELRALSDLADNDKLAAKLAVLIEANLLIILTDVDGLYRNYKSSKPELIRRVSKIDEEIFRLAQKTDSSLSKGGMLSKLEAAKFAASQGVEVAIVNGRIRNVLLARVNNNPKNWPGTTFLAK